MFKNRVVGRLVGSGAPSARAVTAKVGEAVTFELMRRERITRALAFDDDFETAGFELVV